MFNSEQTVVFPSFYPRRSKQGGRLGAIFRIWSAVPTVYLISTFYPYFLSESKKVTKFDICSFPSDISSSRPSRLSFL